MTPPEPKLSDRLRDLAIDEMDDVTRDLKGYVPMLLMKAATALDAKDALLVRAAVIIRHLAQQTKSSESTFKSLAYASPAQELRNQASVIEMRDCQIHSARDLIREIDAAIGEG